LFNGGATGFQESFQSDIISIEDSVYLCLTETGSSHIASKAAPKEAEDYFMELIAILAHALPDPYTEIGWEEIDCRLWPIIEAAWLPLFTSQMTGRLSGHLQRIRGERCAYMPSFITHS
jgi:hypothetical protein